MFMEVSKSVRCGKISEKQKQKQNLLAKFEQAVEPTPHGIENQKAED